MYLRVWKYPATDSAVSTLFEDGLDELLSRGFWRNGAQTGFAPKMDIAEEAKTYRIVAELPGVKKEDVGVTIDDGVLTIKGSRTAEPHESATVLMHERWSGEFQRSVRLPEDVDAGRIEARLVNGILTVDLPKLEEHVARQIQIR